VGVWLSRKKILWSRFLWGLLFTFILGTGEIFLLQNLVSIPAWYYPDGSALGRDWITSFLPNTCFEDILFVPVCFTVFYLFMYLTRNVTDFARDHLPFVGCAFVIGIAFTGYIGGRMAGDMINYLIIPAIVIYLLMLAWDPERFKKVNITHALSALLFVGVFTTLWEYFNAWRRHWIYDTLCELFGKFGWFHNDLLHVGIILVYTWTGFIICYFSWIVFTPRVKKRQT